MLHVFVALLAANFDLTAAAQLLLCRVIRPNSVMRSQKPRRLPTYIASLYLLRQEEFGPYFPCAELGILRAVSGVNRAACANVARVALGENALTGSDGASCAGLICPGIFSTSPSRYSRLLS